MQEIKTGLEMANTMFLKQKSLWEQNIGSEAQYLAGKKSKRAIRREIEICSGTIEYDLHQSSG
jgi:membrane fusion protein (multidrug efflux system)